jgi:hypothetical protein
VVPLTMLRRRGLQKRCGTHAEHRGWYPGSVRGKAKRPRALKMVSWDGLGMLACIIVCLQTSRDL